MKPSQQKLGQLVAGSLIAAFSVFGTAGTTGMTVVGDAPADLPGVPAPSQPNIPDNPIEEGLPVPIPGGGAIAVAWPGPDERVLRPRGRAR